MKTKEKTGAVTATTNNASTNQEAKKPLAVKNISGKPLILRGIVSKITPQKSNFGFSWRIEMDHGANYFLNGKSEDLADRLFKVGEKSAFTVRETPNKKYPEKPYLVIEQVMYVF